MKMNLADHRLILELAEEGIEYREYIADKPLDRERKIVHEALIQFDPPPLKTQQEVKDFEGNECLVAVKPDNNLAYKERCSWIERGFSARMEKIVGQGIAVYAVYGKPADPDVRLKYRKNYSAAKASRGGK